MGKNNTIRGLCALTMIAGATSAAAQEPNVPTLGVTTFAEEDYKQLGIRAGGFTVYPTLEIGGEYNDNIYQRDVVKTDDFITHIKPRFGVESNWSRHHLGFRAASDVAFYGDRSSEDYQDVITDLDGRLDVFRDSYLFGNFGFDYLHQQRGSPDDRNGETPTFYRQFRGKLGYVHKFNRVSVGVEHRVMYSDYDNVDSAAGFVINNDDRDRYRNESSLRVGYEIQPGYEAFVRGIYQTIDYDAKFDDAGLQRSSEGYRVEGGMAFELTHLIHGDVFLGYIDRSYDDRNLDNNDGIVGGINLTWEPTQLTTVRVSLQNDINETTLVNVSGFYSTAFDVVVDHELRRNLILTLRGGYTRNDYQGNQPGEDQREEDIFRAAVGATYLLNRYFYLRGTYSYDDRSVNIPGTEYSLHRVMFSVGSRI